MEYEPFKSPPDFAACRLHARAAIVSNKYSPIVCVCPCCGRQVRQSAMGMCTSPKNLVFLGSETPLLLYFIQILLLLMIFSLFVATGEFLVCNMDDTCQINLNMNFDIMVYKVSIPVGYNDYDGLEMLHLIVLGVYMVLMILFQLRLRAKTSEMEGMFKSNANLSVMLSNVKKSARKNQIKSMFTKLGYEVQLNDIFLPKKLRMWHQVIKLKSKLKKKLLKSYKENKLLEQAELINQLKEIDEVLDLYYNLRQEEARYRTSVVIVRMETEEIRDQFITKYQIGVIMRLWYKLFTCCSKTAIKNQHVSVYQAPPPKDIIWENLQAPYLRTRVLRYLSICVSFFTIIAMTYGTLYLSTFKGQFYEMIGASLLIQLSNILIFEYLERSSSVEDHLTHTNTKKSLTIRLTLFQFINITLMPFIIFAYQVLYEDQTTSKQQLLEQMVTSVMFIFAGNLIKPVVIVWSVERFLRWWARRREAKKADSSELAQYEANKLFEPMEFPIELIYASLVSSLLGTFFYISTIPSIVIIELVVILEMFIAARYLLLKHCKSPKQYTSALNRALTKLAQLCILSYWVGRIAFKIVLSDKGIGIGEEIESMWGNLYFKIEVGIMGGYLLFVILLSLDEWVGKKIGGKKRRTRQELLEMFGRTELDMLYDDAHSFLGLMNSRPAQNANQYLPPNQQQQVQYNLI